MIQNITCIIHGNRKLRSQTKLALHLLNNDPSFTVKMVYTQHMGHASELAEKASIDGTDLVISIGGDGTCNEVINGIMKTKSRPVFGIIPNGTGNDYHRMLGQFNAGEFIKAIKEVQQKNIDITLIEGNFDSKYSLNIVGCGLDGFAVKNYEKTKDNKLIGGAIGYILATLKAILKFKPQNLKIKADTFTYQGKVLMACMCKGRALGHGMVVNTEAELDNGLLSISLFGDVKMIHYLKNYSKFKKGKPLIHPEVQYHQATEVIIEGNEDVYIEADGELVGNLPAKFSVIPSAVTLLHPIYKQTISK